MNSNVKVAIILLNWRGADDTLSCIASLVNSGIKTEDIIVVDNDSQDSSIQVISGKFPNITLLESGKNGGFAFGCNIGLRYAFIQNYDYFWLLNNDTFVNTATLPSMIKEFIKDNNVGIVGSVIRDADFPYDVQYFGGGKVELWLGRVKSCKDPIDINVNLDYITGASMLISREVIKSCGYLDESYFMYWEDVEFCLRASNKGYKIKLAAESTVLHAESSSLEGMSLTKMAMLNSSQENFLRQQTMFYPIILGFNRLVRLIKKILRGQFGRLQEVYIKYENLR